MAKKLSETSRKSRFELLEDRRLLTVWNAAAKFNDNGTADGGEFAFGDNATKTAAQLHSTFNNNYGSGASTITDNATTSSPWTYGTLDSAQTAFSNSTPYSYNAFIDPNSFNNYLTGPDPGGALDGMHDNLGGLAGFFGGPTPLNAITYNYGNIGLNGNGSGSQLSDFIEQIVNIPTGTMSMSPAYGPTSMEFTAPTTGNYTFSITMTNPWFDPFNGPGGQFDANAWSWDCGQADFLVYDVPAGSTSLDNTATLLDSGFASDIASVNAGETSSTAGTLGSLTQTYTAANGGLTINSGPSGGSGPGGAYGSGGTWSLVNAGTSGINVGNIPGTPDVTGDEYLMSWTVVQTVSMAAGDHIQVDGNPEYDTPGRSDGDQGDFQNPIYIAATAQPAVATPTPPTVTTSGSTGQTYHLGSSAVAVDSGLGVTSTDPSGVITGAAMTISNLQSGDSLNYTTVDGIGGSYNSGSGVLTLSGSATPSQYAAALQSVTFSTSSHNTATRTVDVTASDSAAAPHTSNTGVDTVNVAIDAPVVTAHQTSISSTAGQTVTVDSAVTVSSFDTDVTGATMSIGTGFQSGADTLHFSTQNGISGSYNSSSGVLTLSGSATPGNYQTALASVTFSSTSTSTATRNISMVVADSGDTGNVASNTATTQILVSAPITITQAYVKGSAWQSAFLTYLGNNSLGSSTFGYALKTGAAQTTDLPFNNINTIVLSFSGAVSDIGQGSLKLVGGTGPGAAVAPSITGFASLGSNTYSWTLSGSLGNNKYVMALATTGSSFGTAGTTQVVDAHGAGISGHFVTNTSTFPSGNGLANSTFDFFFNVLPGDANQNAAVASSDTALVRPQVNKRSTQAGYSPYIDYNGQGVISSTDVAIDGQDTNSRQSTITSPVAPAAAPVGGSGFTALALGVQESGSSSSGSSSTAVANFTPTSSSSSSSNSSSSSSSGSAGGSGGTSSAGSQAHGRHRFAATDEAVGEFDLSDLWT